MKCIRKYVSHTKFANEDISYASKARKSWKKNKTTSAIPISTKYWIHYGLNVWLELYHCLLRDGYCTLDLFSQGRCNTHHTPKRCIINFDWWNAIMNQNIIGIVSLFGSRWVLHIWLISSNFDWDKIRHKSEISWNCIFVCFVEYLVNSNRKYYQWR